MSKKLSFAKRCNYYIYPLNGDGVGEIYTYQQLINMGVEEKTIQWWIYNHSRFDGGVHINGHFYGLIIINPEGELYRPEEEYVKTDYGDLGIYAKNKKYQKSCNNE